MQALCGRQRNAMRNAMQALCGRQRVSSALPEPGRPADPPVGIQPVPPHLSRRARPSLQATRLGGTRRRRPRGCGPPAPAGSRPSRRPTAATSCRSWAWPAFEGRGLRDVCARGCSGRLGRVAWVGERADGRAKASSHAVPLHLHPAAHHVPPHGMPRDATEALRVPLQLQQLLPLEAEQRSGAVGAARQEVGAARRLRRARGEGGGKKARPRPVRLALV